MSYQVVTRYLPAREFYEDLLSIERIDDMLPGTLHVINQFLSGAKPKTLKPDSFNFATAMVMIVGEKRLEGVKPTVVIAAEYKSWFDDVTTHDLHFEDGDRLRNYISWCMGGCCQTRYAILMSKDDKIKRRVKTYSANNST